MALGRALLIAAFVAMVLALLTYVGGARLLTGWEGWMLGSFCLWLASQVI